MSFFSTRGENCVTASQAILQGIAPDGGLYVPAMFPPVSLSKISEMADMDYISRAVNVLKLFLEDFTIPEIEQAVKAAYGGDRFNLTNIKALGYMIHHVDVGTSIARPAWQMLLSSI